MDKFKEEFQRRLQKEVYGLREVTILEHCGFILYFCLITSRAGTDIDAAIRDLMLVQADKQVIIAVLYLTNEPEKTIPDTNNAIKKENTYFVDFLFNEDEGFMNCQKNKDAINRLAWYIKSKNLTSYYLQRQHSDSQHKRQFDLEERVKKMYQRLQAETITGKYYYVLESCRTGNLWKDILSHLHRQRRHLEEVYSVDKCDVILVLCPITSRIGADIDAALTKLNNLSASKPAIFMVLHHTSDLDKVVPDSGKFVDRMQMLVVDCLFNEDAGLLTCNMNDEALGKVVCCFQPQKQGIIYRLIIMIVVVFAVYILYF
ncbi:uncharacterized protein LOC130229478 isoform X1 [Danio aesculapii]|uniref:uncharacterized protein LOC130229478 isoform X1 n=1 Tax=Danio aesculapii TaxID=1142201 RepID=UPI0024BFC368|nr:uncharacterized protein LOC130229478 isoform X1 [Danio aesculapii]XP_056314277.1 uncharacterized protein LOC130229478 isoform X1 [Danio aesculapii]